jgi:hypothetical protein
MRDGTERQPSRSDIERGLALLQASAAVFPEQADCVSFHHQALPAFALSIAQRQGLAVDERAAESDRKAVLGRMSGKREALLQGFGVSGPLDVAYLLFGPDAGGQAPDSTTDALAFYLTSIQEPDGRWRMLILRPPIASSDLTFTALAVRGLLR